MSTTVDERVVEMRFDNKQFENGVQTSMSTLDKLKRSLNFKDSAKSLSDVSNAAKNVNMPGLSGAVETVHAKFSALEVMGVTALANITNSAMNAGKKLVTAFTIDPVKSGFQEYETKMNAIQTIMSNTASKGTTMSDVTKVIDKLNTYADKTIYNFEEMTRNIGTFTAAGVGLEKSASAIQGIANLAAASGSNPQQASTAMYQLSQALATGTVKLMDWNSVVNAGMGGEKFQEALKATAREHGVAVDNIIKKNGSFRDSLQAGWLSADVLNDTLNKFTVDGAKKYSQSMIQSGKWTQKQADALIKEARAMEDAATKVKTFTQLWDTLKEAAQSGWGQSWEIIVGDFDEAKELFTEISDTLGGLIGKSADSRNQVLKGWKELGGRTAVIDALRNAFEGVGSIIKPISEAFREIFPPITARQLLGFSEGLQDLTAKLKISDATAGRLKSTFKGVFSVFDIVIEAVKAIGGGAISLIKNFTGIQFGILGVTGSFGNYLSNLRDVIVKTDFFGTVVNKVVSLFTGIIEKIKEFGRSLNERLEFSGFEGFIGVLNGIWNAVGQIGSGIVRVISAIGKGVTAAFNGTDFFDVLNNGLFAGILFAIQKFISGLSDPFKNVSGVLENVTGVLDDIRGCFQAYQEQLKAGTLLKISAAIGILAASIFVISTIDTDSLSAALGAIAMLFGELLASLAVFSKITTKMTGVTKSCMAMISMSLAVAILAGALRKIAAISPDNIIKGLVSIGVLMAEISLFLRVAKFNGKITSTAFGIVILSSAILILGRAIKSLGNMQWGEIGKGLTSVALLLAELATFTRLAGNAKHVISTGVAMVLLGVSMKILASVMKDFGSIKMSELGKGLLAMGGALAELAIAMRFMPKNMISSGAGLVIVGAAIKILANALSDLGGMSWNEIGKGLTAMGGALAELAIGLNLMNGTLSGTTALLIASGALAIMTPVLKSLGNMSWGEIGKGLVALAGAFTVIGVAGLLLSPLLPTILGLAGAFALFGAATLGIGAGLVLTGVGLTAIAGGFTALAAAGAAGATAFVASLTVIITGIANMIPMVAGKLGEGIIAFAKVIGECAPQLADSFLKLITETLNSFATYTPQIIASLMTFLIGVINGIADHLPDLIAAAVNLIGAFFKGVIDALSSIDTETLFNGIMAVGLLSGLMVVLSSIAGFIPGAMVGVLGIGVVIAELALVLAAIGALAKIPGLQWLIEEGGHFLQTVGTAIGQFIGGIVGGFMGGVSSSFPQIGSNLSAFMINVRPFVNGAKEIDTTVLNGIKNLGAAIMIITAADVLNGVSSWLTGGSSLVDFANQLIPFGKGMKSYGESVAGIDGDVISSSTTAARALAELANNLPSRGGLSSIFTGNKSIANFGEQLVPFGRGMKQYSDAITGLNTDAVVSSANAASALSELANNLPNSGGLIALLTGDNDLFTFAIRLIPLGQAMKSYADSVAGIDPTVVENSATAAKALSELANNLPNTGGLVALFTGDNDLITFGSQLVPFGKSMKSYANEIAGIDGAAVTSSANAATALAKLCENIPNTGGLISLFTGDNSISTFGEQLAPFGCSMKLYADSVSGIDTTSVEASANAAKTLSELANNLPNTGGLVALFTGDNSISTFGDQLAVFGYNMKDYAISVEGIDTSSVEASANAAKVLAELLNNLPNSGGLASLFAGESSLSNFGTQLVPFGKGLKQYSDSVAGIDSESVISSATAAKSLVKLLEILPNSGGLASLFTGETDISKFGEQLVPFAKGMKKYSDSVAGIDADAISNSADAAKSLGKLLEILPNSGGLASFFTGDADFSEFGTQLVPFGKGLKQYSDSVAEIDADAVMASASAAKKLVGIINSMAGLDSSGVNVFKNAVNILGKTRVDQFVNVFASVAPKLTSVGASMVVSLTNGLKSKQIFFTSAAINMVTTMRNSLDNKAITFTALGVFLINKIIQGVESQKSRIISTLTSSISGAVWRIRNYYSSFYNAGSYLVSGFAGGISANSYKAAAKARAMASAAANAAEDELDINSPSKVFYGIGDYSGQGFVNALGAYARKSYDAGSKMALSAKEGLGKAISKITDVINNDIDAQPTIRPVLDLSAVSAGAGEINGMFGMRPSMRVLSNIGAISSMMDGRYSSDNGDVISAIKDLKDTISKSAGNTYSINGVTYDDGSNIADAVKTLVRAARVERRV